MKNKRWYLGFLGKENLGASGNIILCHLVVDFGKGCYNPIL